MRIDDRRLDELIVESQDLQSDAIREAEASLPELRELSHERGTERSDPAEIDAFNASRRGLLSDLGLTSGGKLAAGGVLFGGIGAALVSLLASPAAADQNLDVQMLQTASSLERLAVNTYGTALTLPFIKSGNQVVVKFAETTMMQHDQHRQAFQAQTTALGGKVQDSPNPKYQAVVAQAAPNLKSPLDVVKLAASLEKVATDTYLTDLTMFADVKSKQVMGSVMGVECQHLATLLAVQALLEGNAPELIAIPTNLAKLPAAAGSVAFPNAFEQTTADTVAAPSTGAVQ
ncbi:MAG: hypothetical protein QOG64_127 [Acidimicrobiaceae bacterium]|nr:hypothetical protein [Acidimicrobiaceae bacterium]